MTTQCCFTHLHLKMLCFKKIDFFPELSEEKVFKIVHIFIARFIAYYIKLIPYRRSFQPYNQPGRFNLFFDPQKCPETIERS